MRTVSDPNDTLVRLVRGTVYDSAPHQVAKLRALSGVSAIGAAAYARARASRAPATRTAKPSAAPVSVDNEPAIVMRFHAAAATTMIQAMIAAAAADGEIDDLENRRILGYLRDSDATPEELAFARKAMEHPVTAEALAEGVDGGETAIEIYAAALLASQAATAGGRLFLARLSRALKLDRAFVTKLHASWGDPPPE
jgi:uncharacterized membrane protein YebE (DUF533 family)